MKVVADHVMMRGPTLSKLVDRMVAANLVHRRSDDEDRRRVLVMASTPGKRALEQWDEATADIRQQYRELLGSEAKQFEKLLRRLQRGIPPAGRAATVAAIDPGESVAH